MRKIPVYFRYIIAVLVGILAGNILSMPIANILGNVTGREVINSTTSLSFLNVSYMIIIGFITGLFTGLIAGKRGKILAVVAQFSFLTLMIVFSLIINRDILSRYGEYGLSFWTWVGLLPAILGGHYGVRIINMIKKQYEEDSKYINDQEDISVTPSGNPDFTPEYLASIKAYLIKIGQIPADS